MHRVSLTSPWTMWQGMHRLQRLDIVVLGLMLVYVVVVVVRVCYCCHFDGRTDQGPFAPRTRKQLITELNLQVGNLKSIALIAPYLGLAGTCIGIITGLGNIGFEAESGLAAVIATGVVPIAAATTIAGIFVAVPANCFYHYLQSRIDLVKSELPEEPPKDRTVSRFPFTKRFSQLPTFALVAASSLAVLTGAFTPYISTRPIATGLDVELASDQCDVAHVDRFIVLRVTNTGQIFINEEQQDWNTLGARLSEIYRVRKYRILGLLAEDDVPYQTVADAIDIARNVPRTARPDSLDITVQLITPATRCVSTLVARRVDVPTDSLVGRGRPTLHQSQ